MPEIVERALQIGSKTPDGLWTAKLMDGWLLQAQAERKMRKKKEKPTSKAVEKEDTDTEKEKSDEDMGEPSASAGPPASSSGNRKGNRGPKEPQPPPPPDDPEEQLGGSIRDKQARHHTTKVKKEFLEFEVVESEDEGWSTPREKEEVPPTQVEPMPKLIIEEETELMAGSSSSPPRITLKGVRDQAEKILARRLLFEPATGSS